MACLSSFIADRRGAAAAELALLTPLLMIILFGTMELGNYFADEHVVVKAVRDGARFAARQPFTNYTGCSGAPGGTVAADTQNLVRTGALTGGTARLHYWTDNATVTVTVSCLASGGGQTFTGLYSSMASGGRIVTVSASVPYTPLLGAIGFSTAGLALNASSQAAVSGI